MFSSIELLDEEQRKMAVKMQNQLRGMRLVIDLAEDLVNQSKALGIKEESTDNEDKR